MFSLQTTYYITILVLLIAIKSPHLESHDVLKKMKEFESNPQVKPMHIAIRQYMHMAGVMCLYIRAVGTGS